jgi:hypothetical protein
MAEDETLQKNPPRLADLAEYRRLRERKSKRPPWHPWLLGTVVVLGFVAGLILSRGRGDPGES